MIDIQSKVNENLAIGKEIKNYKVLCELLDEKVVSGNSKISQLENIKRYIEYEKDGNKFIITKIYDEPKPFIDNRHNGNNGIYVTYIEKLLLHILSEQENQTLICTKNYLLVAVGITNNKYIDKTIRETLVKSKAFKKSEINEFDRRTYQVLDKILASSLNSLKRRCLISWTKQLHYTKKDIGNRGKKFEGIATEDEIRKYDDIKLHLLEELSKENGGKNKYDDLRDVYIHNKSKEFYTRLHAATLLKFGWETEFMYYHIIFTQNNVINAIPKSTDQLQQKLELNGKVVEALNSSVEKNYDKMKNIWQAEYDTLSPSDKEVYDMGRAGWKLMSAFNPPWDYVSQQNSLTDQLIKLS